MSAFALDLLLLGLLAHYAWQWVPPDRVADVWTLCTHTLSVVLLLTVGMFGRDRRLWLVVLLLVAFNLQVVGCTAWWLLDPWPVTPEDELCSARLGWPLGAVGLALGLWLTGGLYVDAKKEAGHGP